MGFGDLSVDGVAGFRVGEITASRGHFEDDDAEESGDRLGVEALVFRGDGSRRNVSRARPAKLLDEEASEIELTEKLTNAVEVQWHERLLRTRVFFWVSLVIRAISILSGKDTAPKNDRGALSQRRHERMGRLMGQFSAVSHYAFEWDAAKARANEAKHAVAFDEAQTCFSDLLAIESFDIDHSVGEDRFIIIGMSERNRLLVVAFTLRGHEMIRIISAREALRKERFDYEKQAGSR